MNKELESILLEACQSSSIKKVELIQSLWSGYGELNRVIHDKGSVILKIINPPSQNDHPRGWNSDFGHQRKIKSYVIENYWYENYNFKIDQSYYPRLIKSGKWENHHFLILENLEDKNYVSKNVISDAEIKYCLSWLAHFHNYFLNKKPLGLWETGTYWHLDTRPEEFERIEDTKLKEAARAIDLKLKNAKFQTIVHGDAKLANFLFNHHSTAAVDFQYVGGGVGVKDLAYFLSSIFEEDELYSKSDQYIDYYFEILKNPEVEKEWRELYAYAWCDFYRFLQGWSPGHWKINSYSEEMKNKVLKCL